MLDPCNPAGSTAHVRFTTSRTTRWETDAGRCRVNWAVCEQRLGGRVLSSDRVDLLKNHNLGLEVPYRYGSKSRRYRTDFVVLVDDGRGGDDLLLDATAAAQEAQELTERLACRRRSSERHRLSGDMELHAYCERDDQATDRNRVPARRFSPANRAEVPDGDIRRSPGNCVKESSSCTVWYREPWTRCAARC